MHTCFLRCILRLLDYSSLFLFFSPQYSTSRVIRDCMIHEEQQLPSFLRAQETRAVGAPSSQKQEKKRRRKKIKEKVNW